jgi:hypothetical protein
MAKVVSQCSRFYYVSIDLVLRQRLNLEQVLGNATSDLRNLYCVSESVMENMPFGGVNYLGNPSKASKDRAVKNAVAVPLECVSLIGLSIESMPPV